MDRRRTWPCGGFNRRWALPAAKKFKAWDDRRRERAMTAPSLESRVLAAFTDRAAQRQRTEDRRRRFIEEGR